MTKTPALPTTLREAVIYFADAERALAFMVDMRWSGDVVCPRCEAKKPSFLKSRRIWKCSATNCRKQFSVKVGTVFEDSPLGLDKWLPALWMLANCRNGISSYELARHLGTTQKTAWFMLGRIRLAMKSESFVRTSGTVEIDESFVGGLAYNMHKSRKARMLKGAKAGPTGKIGVIAAVVRENDETPKQVQAYVLNSMYARPYGRMANETVLPGSKVYTDSAAIYKNSLDGYSREMVDHHAKEWVRGDVHTNNVENFWSTLKRALKGTYISVDPAHLFRYVDEQAFRYNVKDLSERARFQLATRRIVGKRLTYAKLIGSEL